MTSSNNESAFFTNSRGQQIHFKQWVPQTRHGGILFAHGIGEHSGRYESVARFFCDRHIAFYAIDHQGHGQSDGKRGHVTHFDNYVQDLDTFRKAVQHCHGKSPLFLMGHSMGGLIAFKYLLKHQDHVQGAILSAPSLKIKMQVPVWKHVLASSLAQLAPAITVKNGINADLLTHDETIVNLYRHDPLVHPFISLALYFDMIQAGVTCLEEADKITCPILFLFGGNDQITDIEATKHAFDRINTPDKQFHEFKDKYHEILNELNKNKVFHIIYDWIASRLP